MKVCIAEKPSVAKDLATVLGAKERKEGYFEGNGYQVTWTFGHLFTLKEPHDYSPRWKPWVIHDLPIIPPQFGIKLIENTGVKKQFETIEKLVQNCEEVINCGDAGQEGELIQRWVLLKASSKAPLKRLWISSLTENAIKEGFSNLKPGSAFDNLYAAGSARAIGDWLLGINATRLYTKKFGQGKTVLSIGRVQTPTLAMIVQRQKEINAFTIAIYWELKTVYRGVEFTATIDRLHQEDRALKGLDYLQQNKLFTITSFEKKEGKEGNPRLFDLTGLQVEANKKLGYSADETLKYVQNLYEKKHVTYPRVDTTYLSEDLHPQIGGILQNLPNYYQTWAKALSNAPIPKLKSVFDNTKVTDHHAIIPTESAPNANLSTEEKKIYDLITRRFIAAFYPECKISNTTVLGTVGQIEFKATGKQIIEPGWKSLYIEEKKATNKENSSDEEKEEEEKILPEFAVGESGPHEPKIHKGKTTPPKPYTEATLLRAMETAGKQVENDEMRDLLKENGIGRPSTRANIIETLFKRKYIEKKKKNIFATDTGMDLIDTIQNELLKSAELTGVWEKKIRLIEKGEYAIDTFKKELIDMVSSLTSEVKNQQYKAISISTPTDSKERELNSTAQKKEEKLETEKKPSFDAETILCPKCKSHTLLKGNTAYGCKNFKICGFKIPFSWKDKKLTAKNIEDLLKKGESGKMTIVDGEVKKNIRLKMDAHFQIQEIY